MLCLTVPSLQHFVGSGNAPHKNYHWPKFESNSCRVTKMQIKAAAWLRIMYKLLWKRDYRVEQSEVKCHVRRCCLCVVQNLSSFRHCLGFNVTNSASFLLLIEILCHDSWYVVTWIWIMTYCEMAGMKSILMVTRSMDGSLMLLAGLACYWGLLVRETGRAWATWKANVFAEMWAQSLALLMKPKFFWSTRRVYVIWTTGWKQVCFVSFMFYVFFDIFNEVTLGCIFLKFTHVFFHILGRWAEWFAWYSYGGQSNEISSQPRDIGEGAIRWRRVEKSSNRWQQVHSMFSELHRVWVVPLWLVAYDPRQLWLLTAWRTFTYILKLCCWNCVPRLAAFSLFLSMIWRFEH